MLGQANQAVEFYREANDAFFSNLPTFEALAPDDASRAVARRTHEANRARAAVLREWTLSPFWLTGIASPSDLSDAYSRMFDAERELGDAWAGLIRSWSEDATDVARRTFDESNRLATAALDVRERMVDDTVDALEESGRRSAAAGRSAATAMREASEEAVSAARPVRGTTTRDGELIYHLPGQSSYDRIQEPVLFATQTEAQAAGYRLARSPGGPSIKGNVNRDGERIYHLPGQANYDRIEPEMLFESEAQAEAEGFRPAQR
jgi:hypothetical protein